MINIEHFLKLSPSGRAETLRSLRDKKVFDINQFKEMSSSEQDRFLATLKPEDIRNLKEQLDILESGSVIESAARALAQPNLSPADRVLRDLSDGPILLTRARKVFDLEELAAIPSLIGDGKVRIVTINKESYYTKR